MSPLTYKQASFLSDSRVLLIDPDRTNRTILSGFVEDMKPAGFTPAKSMAEAHKYFGGRVSNFELILLAVKNPPTSGFHFLQDVRSGRVHGIPRDMRIVIVSPPPNRTMIELAASLDADGFVALPMSSATVSGALEKALKRERSIKDSEEYLSVQLPKPVEKKKKEKKEQGANAWVVWSKKEKEKAELLKSLEAALKTVEDKPAVEPTRIENIKTFWLKDLRDGMILAEDITGDEEELLLATGTPLNDALIDKIKKFSEIGLCRSFLKAGAAPAV